MQLNRGTLVISLDFELVWGIFDHIIIKDRVNYFNDTINTIPKMLDLFVKNDIHVTWATVGMLFNRNWEEWEHNVPIRTPNYQNKTLDAYAYGRAHRNSGYDRFFFAPNLVKQIQLADNQELATHTYSHYYCLEPGQTKADFEADLDKAAEISAEYGNKIQSLVFPRNQLYTDYLPSCVDRGITSVRSNPAIWYWDTAKATTLKTKIFRTADAYIPFKPKGYPFSSLNPDVPQQQPASRFLRPQHKYSLLNSLRLKRIQDEMIAAAKKGEIYHLWWHPHNFGIDSEGALKNLGKILETFKYCKEKFNFQSLSMEEMQKTTYDKTSTSSV